MKKLLFLFLSFVVIFSCVGCRPEKTEVDTTVDMTPRLISTSGINDFADVAETVRSAIVGVSVKLSNGSSLGSGVAIADNGYVLTNQHVISGQKDITLYLADKTTTKADLIWSDSSIDLAILKSAKNIPYLSTAPLSDVKIGDDVLAVGTPLSLQFQHTFTKGIVSALNRTLEIQSLGGYTTYMQNLIQHDASINSGNSGGPLINSQGKVIGINSLKASDAEGIGFAIPIETATAIAERVIPDANFEQVRLGVFGCDAELAKFKNETDLDKGVFVLDVKKGSIMSLTGLRAGDVIVSINDEKITNNLDFRKAIYKLNPGEEVRIGVYNAGQTREIVINI